MRPVVVVVVDPGVQLSLRVLKAGEDPVGAELGAELGADRAVEPLDLPCGRG